LEYLLVKTGEIKMIEPTTVLFLAANPKDTEPLRLGEEVRRIDESLRRSKQRDKFKLTQRWAVQIPDLHRAFLDENPNIVHFSGHGSKRGRIYLEDKIGMGQEVKPEALANFFALFKDHVSCVVLNACYAEIQANEIVRHIPYVVGMNNAIPDKAAIEFSEAFYDALGSGRDFEFAFKLGCSAIELHDLNAEQVPVLKRQKSKNKS
jgi:CHAT domain